MPNQGDLKWVKGEKMEKGDIAEAIGDLDDLQISYTVSLLIGFAGLIIGGFVGMAIGGASIGAIVADRLYDKQKDDLTNILKELKGKPDSTEIQIKLQYRYTEKEGGIWIPTYKMSYEIID